MERTEYQILRALDRQPASFWEIVRSQDSTLSEVTETLRSMLSGGKLSFDPGTRRFALENPTDLTPVGNGLCPTCQGRGFILPDPFGRALERFRELTRDRPPPLFEYNQGIIDSKDLALKSVVMYIRGDLEKRSILLVGDDDLFSIFLALLDLSSNLTVLEIDGRLIDYINRKAEQTGLAVNALQYDVKTPLPPRLSGTYNAFVTEPPEGLKGMLLFLERAIESLAPRGAGYFGLTTLESSLPKWLAIQKFLVERQMAITDLLRNFSLYPEALDPIDNYDQFPLSREFPVDPGPPDVDYFRSALIRIEKTAAGTIEQESALYTDQDTLVTVDPGDKG
ncbi:MAG: bis-aminopropyl spermidine synthase family protein [Deltaproteobacteria bacterium]|nr:bis-aminopropyl spermidine synthase family protein [Deltaproteobacteria bacterium]MBW2120672.1 bis-aminopropyl spermidine synthase family protein [Deltaproteobacteria bacterium]